MVTLSPTMTVAAPMMMVAVQPLLMVDAVKNGTTNKGARREQEAVKISCCL